MDQLLTKDPRYLSPMLACGSCQVDLYEPFFEPLVDLLDVLFWQVDVIASEIKAGSFLVVHLVIDELVDKLHDCGTGSVVRLACLEPSALLEVVADGEARHHHRPLLRLLLKPGNERL